MRLPLRLAFCAALLAPTLSVAQTIGPAQADALQQQLKDWLAGLLGPGVKLPDLPWKVSGEGDHYLITWPLAGTASPTGEMTTTVTLRPLDGGRWSVDDVKMPPSGDFSMTIPDAGDDGKAGPMHIAFKIGKQDTHGVFDPSFATQSALHAEAGDLLVTTDGAKQRQEQRFDRYVVDSSLKPATDGRVDLVVDASVDGWKSASQINGGAPVAIGIQSMRAVGRVNGVNRDRVTAMLAATGSLISVLPPDIGAKSGTKDLPAPAKTQLRLIIESLQDMMTGVTLEETVDGLQVEVPGMGGFSLKHFLLGFGAEAPDGRLHTWVNLGLDEIASPSLPPKIAAYLPHHAEIKPSVSGIRMADLHKLALDATEDDKADLAPDVAVLFAHGGIDFGVETLAFDLGPAKIAGTGHVTMTSPATWHGEAHVTATGFDELAAQARTNPDLQEALPVLIMMRGLAKPDGKALVWDIVSDGPAVMVNGLDLSQLGGGDKPKDKPMMAKPGQPPRR